MAGEGGFGRMMQNAVKLKEHQMKKERTQFNRWPDFVQHSLYFRPEDVDATRRLPHHKRVVVAATEKQAGNNHYKAGRMHQAVTSYEQALSLIEYLRPTRADWKKRGIRDSDVELVTDIDAQHPQALPPPLATEEMFDKAEPLGNKTAGSPRMPLREWGSEPSPRPAGDEGRR